MSHLLFGTAGVPKSARGPTTQAGIERIAELGLECLEVQFVQGVKMTKEAALPVGKLAAQKRVTLTVHAPYAINLNAKEPEKVKASQERLLQSARVAAVLGAKGIVFHAAFYLGDAAAAVYVNVKKHLEEVRTMLKREDNQVLLRPEVTGKASQFGSIEELLSLSTEIEGVAPCLDFSHWHARTGQANSYPEFLSILDQVEAKLGKQALSNMHIHLSGIHYSKKGEIKHLELRESDLRYKELLKALKAREVSGLIVCESPNLEDDALLLQQSYREASA
ncbi:MAG: TIM barrel protein [Chloroflexi bacterium]|nr:TIM barrel protein [Chloroflexota bacterium]